MKKKLWKHNIFSQEQLITRIHSISNGKSKYKQSLQRKHRQQNEQIISRYTYIEEAHGEISDESNPTKIDIVKM